MKNLHVQRLELDHRKTSFLFMWTAKDYLCDKIPTPGGQ